MKRATISELKNRLSAYLKEAQAGETILVFDRDQPVARIERVEAEAHPEGLLARLELAGLLRRGRGRMPISCFDRRRRNRKKACESSPARKGRAVKF